MLLAPGCPETGATLVAQLRFLALLPKFRVIRILRRFTRTRRRFRGTVAAANVTITSAAAVDIQLALLIVFNVVIAMVLARIVAFPFTRSATDRTIVGTRRVGGFSPKPIF